MDGAVEEPEFDRLTGSDQPWVDWAKPTEGIPNADATRKNMMPPQITYRK
jgi:hypothetical protein